MSRDDPLMRIRLPDELKAKVKALADANHRSMNAEIVARLEASVASNEPGTGLSFVAKAKEHSMALFDKRLSALERRLAKIDGQDADE